MKIIMFIFLLSGALMASAQNTQLLPVALPANFTDDYGVKYNVSYPLFFQLPSSKYCILRWNAKEQNIIAKNGMDNREDKGLYTRIDYMKFENMEPFRCIETEGLSKFYF